MNWLTRLQNSVRFSKVADDAHEEIEFHLEQRTAEYIGNGVDPVEARRRAEARFGSAIRAQENTCDARVLPRLESLIADAKFGLRQMSRNKMLTGAAVLSLGLALGAVTAAFAIIDAILLRPLPVHNPQELVYLGMPGPPSDPERIGDSFNYPLFRALRDAGRGKVDLFLVSYQGARDVRFDGTDEIENIALQMVSGDAFHILGVGPYLGRVIQPDDDKAPGDRPVAVLSYDFWKKRFGGDPAVIGRKLVFNERRLEIVGIARKDFLGLEPGVRTDVWVPASMQRAESFQAFGHHWFRIFGRLRNGATREQVRDALSVTFKEVRRQNFRRVPGLPKDFEKRYMETNLVVASAAVGPSDIRFTFKKALWVLGGTVLLVLLTAAVNVANLLLARAAARQREMALRLSIGAGKGRLIQQMLTESSLFAVFALALGAVVGIAGAPLLVDMLSRFNRPLTLDLRIDWRFAAFITATTAFITVLLGLIPAFRATRAQPSEDLKAAGNRASGSPVVFRAFLTAQVAFCFLALFSAALFVSTMRNLRSVDIGFQPDGITLFEISAPALDAMPGKGVAVWRQALDAIRSAPEVQSVTSTSWGLFTNSAWNEAVHIPGAPDAVIVNFHGAGPSYHEVMGIRLKNGRTFSERETYADPMPPAVVVNEAFARKYYNGTDPVGSQFQRMGGPNRPVQLLQVVGVVGDSKYNSLRKPVDPMIYVPMAGGNWQTMAVRGPHTPSAIQEIRRRVAQVHPAMKVTNVVSQSRLVADSLVQERVLSMLSTFFAALAVVLAAIGLYGVLSYTTVQRTREIGIRVALGAKRIAVVRLVVRDAVLLTIVGAVVGGGAGLALSKYVQTLLFGVKPFEPAALLIPILVLLAAAAVASAMPALRAVQIQPSTALRYE